MTDDLVLDVHELYAGYDDTPVVRGLNLQVRPGEIVALLGPNGAGKTTSLLTFSGLLKPISGEMRVLGGPVESSARAHRMARRGLAHVPEDRGLFFNLTVRENIRLGVGKRSSAAGQLASLVRYFPALEPLLGRRAGLLSGGEQQMVALGRAIAGQPRLLLVDEMSLGLAPVIVERLMPVLRQVVAETKTSVLLVEQHVHTALKVADRAYILSQGRLAYEGPPADLINDPSLITASYLAAS